MGCCGCFGFLKKSSHRPLFEFCGIGSQFPQDLVLLESSEDWDNILFSGDSDGSTRPRSKTYEEILLARTQGGGICREIAVKETHKVTLSEVFHKSYLLKLRVASSETAMNDVLREASIMKMLAHPNIVKLIEVIDDPLLDEFYMVLEYVEGKLVSDRSGPARGIGENKSRRLLRDVVAGLMYLHAHNIIHGDIKPDNLLVTSTGRAKIGDFSVSQVFEDDNDELRRSPGTPVFTAPECCLGLTYHGRAADAWAVGVTLYYMTTGEYPFIGVTLQETYDKIVNSPLSLPDDINPQLKDLLERFLCKDPKHRISLHAVAVHPWVVEEEGPIPDYQCRHSKIATWKLRQF